MSTPPKLHDQDFWAEGRFLGRSQRPDELVHGQWRTPPSQAYFCPTCGEVWARVVVPNQEFTVWSMPCRKHQPRFRLTVAGSLYRLWDRDFNDSFPRGALLREVLVHADWIEKDYWREDLLKGALE